MRSRTLRLLAVTLLASAGLYGAAYAIMSAGVFRMLITEQTTIGNSMPKTGGAYSLMGSTGQLGYGKLSGGNYSLTWGAVNSWRPP